jgi:MFS family permease
MSHHQKFFYGWWVVMTASLGLCLSTGPIVILTFGVFFKALTQDFHADRAAVSLGFTLHNLIGAVCIPLIGRLIDRVGARRVILTCTAVFGLILLSSEILKSRIGYLYMFYAALGIVGGGTSPVPYGVIVSRWFDRSRGLALGLMAFGAGLGGIFLPMLAHRLIAMFTWRIAYASFGCAALVLSLPIVGIFLVESPTQKGLFADAAVPTQRSEYNGKENNGLTWNETWHEPKFWLLICALFLVGASLFGCVIHLPVLLTDRGMSAQGAAAASSLVGFALLISRIGAGCLLDRFFAPHLAMLFFGCAALGIILLAAAGTGKIAMLAAFLLGLGMGADVDIMVYLISRYFGLRALGTTFGYAFGSYALAGACGVWLMGAAFDFTHSYAAFLGGFFIAVLLAVTLIARLGPYRYAPEPQIARLRPVVSVETGIES